MSPSDAAGTSDTDRPSGWSTKLFGYAAAVLGFVLGRIAPGAVLIPLASLILAAWLLGKYGRPERKPYFPAVAILIAHAGWILVGFFLLHAVTYAVVFLLADAIPAVHIYAAPTKNAVYGWSTVQGLMALNYFLPVVSVNDEVVAAAYIVHVGLCVLAIANLVGAYRRVNASLASVAAE